MPDIYGPEQPWTEGDITENIVSLSDIGIVVDDAEDGTVQTELGDGKITEGEVPNISTVTAEHEPKEASGGTIPNKVGDTPVPERSAGTIEKAVTERNVLEDAQGTVDTEISDDEIMREETGTTDRDVADDAATQEVAGVINRELGMSSCII